MSDIRIPGNDFSIFVVVLDCIHLFFLFIFLYPELETVTNAGNTMY